MTRLLSLATVIMTIFSLPGAVHGHKSPCTDQTTCVEKAVSVRVEDKDVIPKRPHQKGDTIQGLAGPYAALVIASAKANHLPPALVAAVVQVENGGNFKGSATRVSSAGAIGVMQLEPTTAWDVLRVNPWQAPSNIAGGSHFLHELIERFHNNVRLALMAYNAGPTLIAQGARPTEAVWYANKVMRLAEGVKA